MTDFPLLLKEGDLAPDFSTTLSDGSTITLSGFRGRTLILYFYPKDNTSGCTQQACDFQRSLPRILEKDVVLLAVSRDSLTSHDNFSKKHNLTFPLISDTDHKICTAYGTIVEKSMYGKKYMGIERTTFLIDTVGRIQKIWRKVKVPGHVEAIISHLART